MSGSDDQRVVLVTGAGSGLGRGLCGHLGARGWLVVATDLNLEAAEATAAQVRADAGQAISRPMDVRDLGQVERAVASLPDEGRVDLLINNAGVQHVARLEEFPPQRWDELVDVMLNGACRVVRTVLPGMRSRGFGRIVNIGSIHSVVASPFKSVYVAAKHGLLGFAKTVALETADVDITINTVCPSYVRTPLVDAQIRAQAAAHGIDEGEVIDRIMLKPMPKHAFITVEEIAAAVEFLASPLARNITGQSIVIDGGWTAA